MSAPTTPNSISISQSGSSSRPSRPSRPFSPSPPRDNIHTSSRPPSLFFGDTALPSSLSMAGPRTFNILGLPDTPESRKSTAYEGMPRSEISEDLFGYGDREIRGRRTSSRVGRPGEVDRTIAVPELAATRDSLSMVRNGSLSSTSSSSPPLGSASILATLASEADIPPISSSSSRYSTGHSTPPNIPPPRSPQSAYTNRTSLSNPSSISTSKSMPRLHQPTVVRSVSGRGVSFLPPPGRVVSSSSSSSLAKSRLTRANTSARSSLPAVGGEMKESDRNKRYNSFSGGEPSRPRPNSYLSDLGPPVRFPLPRPGHKVESADKEDQVAEGMLERGVIEVKQGGAEASTASSEPPLPYAIDKDILPVATDPPPEETARSSSASAADESFEPESRSERGAGGSTSPSSVVGNDAQEPHDFEDAEDEGITADSFIGDSLVEGEADQQTPSFGEDEGVTMDSNSEGDVAEVEVDEGADFGANVEDEGMPSEPDSEVPTDEGLDSDLTPRAAVIEMPTAGEERLEGTGTGVEAPEPETNDEIGTAAVVEQERTVKASSPTSPPLVAESNSAEVDTSEAGEDNREVDVTSAIVPSLSEAVNAEEDLAETSRLGSAPATAVPDVLSDVAPAAVIISPPIPDSTSRSVEKELKMAAAEPLDVPAITSTVPDATGNPPLAGRATTSTTSIPSHIPQANPHANDEAPPSTAGLVADIADAQAKEVNIKSKDTGDEEVVRVEEAAFEEVVEDQEAIELEEQSEVDEQERGVSEVETGEDEAAKTGSLPRSVSQETILHEITDDEVDVSMLASITELPASLDAEPDTTIYLPPYQPRKSGRGRTYRLSTPPSASPGDESFAITLLAGISRQSRMDALSLTIPHVELYLAWSEPRSWLWVPARKLIPAGFDLRLVGSGKEVELYDPAAKEKQEERRGLVRGVVRGVVGRLPIVWRFAGWV